jgi:glutamate racemase
LEHLLEPLAGSGADALGLGCTHYPFLRGRIQRLVGSGVQVLDSGDAVARRVRAVLIERTALASTGAVVTYALYSTGDPVTLARAARRYLRLPPVMVRRIDLGPS